MIETPQIVQSAPLLTAYIHVIVAREEIQSVMGPGLRELSAAVAVQGIEATGPWFTHHLRRPSDTFDFEICLPVASPVKPMGRVEAGELATATVARTVYHGDYSGLAAAWGEFESWITSNGHAARGDIWERYRVGPDASRDPADWRTELNQPLIGT